MMSPEAISRILMRILAPAVPEEGRRTIDALCPAAMKIDESAFGERKQSTNPGK